VSSGFWCVMTSTTRSTLTTAWCRTRAACRRTRGCLMSSSRPLRSRCISRLSARETSPTVSSAVYGSSAALQRGVFSRGQSSTARGSTPRTSTTACSPTCGGVRHQARRQRRPRRRRHDAPEAARHGAGALPHAVTFWRPTSRRPIAHAFPLLHRRRRPPQCAAAGSTMHSRGRPYALSRGRYFDASLTEPIPPAHRRSRRFSRMCWCC